ncbi:MAG TPA: sterol desaturase family protein [Methyloversatilis sp.]
MSDLMTLWLSMIEWSSSHVVIPVLLFLHINDASLNTKEIAEAGLVVMIQVSIIAFVFRPLESIVPAEKWADRKLTGIDRLYTLLMLFGLFPIFSYVVMSPFSHMFGNLDAAPGSGDSVFDLRHQIPWLDAHPLVLLGLYYLLYDFVYYWLHRIQHIVPWWWALHSMHHSQRQMSCWTNDRGSYLDGMVQSVILATVGIVMGVDLAEFAVLTMFSELMQNFSHANVRIGFGQVLEKIFVDPKFHRLHHMKVDEERTWLHNCNFGQVFSIWDVLFGTALYGEPVRPTGVTDPVVDADNGRGLIAMQWYTLKRFWGAFRRPAGWRPGDVGFGEDYEPIPSSYRMDAAAGHADVAPVTH